MCQVCDGHGAGNDLAEDGASVEGVEVVIVMDYSLPLDLPIAVIPYLSSAGMQKHTGVMLHRRTCLEKISLKAHLGVIDIFPAVIRPELARRDSAPSEPRIKLFDGQSLYYFHNPPSARCISS